MCERGRILTMFHICFFGFGYERDVRTLLFLSLSLLTDGLWLFIFLMSICVFFILCFYIAGRFSAAVFFFILPLNLF